MNILNAIQQNLFQTQQAAQIPQTQHLQTLHRHALQSHTHARPHACTQQTSQDGADSGPNGLAKQSTGNQANIQNYLQNLQKKQAIRLSDPKNLRNFFIQSSLTFNGNNLNSQGQNSLIH